jgi:hypothetical protein
LAPAGPTKTSPIYANHRTSVTLAFAVDKRRWSDGDGHAALAVFCVGWPCSLQA